MVAYTTAQIMEKTVKIGRMVEAVEELESRISGIAALDSDIAELKFEVKEAGVHRIYHEGVKCF